MKGINHSTWGDTVQALRYFIHCKSRCFTCQKQTTLSLLQMSHFWTKRRKVHAFI